MGRSALGQVDANVSVETMFPAPFDLDGIV